MNVGIMGLGKMGLGMGTRLSMKDHKVAGYDVMPKREPTAAAAGVKWVANPAEFSQALEPPRTIILSVPAGDPVDSAIESVIPALSKGDVIIDTGNSFYKDSIQRSSVLLEVGINLLDAGISGGIWGLENGYCLMVGGDEAAFKKTEKIFADLAPENGYAYMGKSGSGHFVKMVHNGVEYGMLEAYAEGFEIMRASDFNLDMAKIADLWNHGSVVRSWMLELAKLAFDESPDLADIKGWVDDSGEGRWTVTESIEQRVPAPVIALSLMMRFRSRQDDSYAAKVIAALRNKFGGHAVKKE